MVDLLLTPEQEAEAQRLAAVIGRKAQEEVLRMARILASRAPTPNSSGPRSSRSATGPMTWPPMRSRPL
jgi:hypothetical protein